MSVGFSIYSFFCCLSWMDLRIIIFEPWVCIYLEKFLFIVFIIHSFCLSIQNLCLLFIIFIYYFKFIFILRYFIFIFVGLNGYPCLSWVDVGSLNFELQVSIYPKKIFIHLWMCMYFFEKYLHFWPMNSLVCLHVLKEKGIRDLTEAVKGCLVT